jgi:flagellar motility protein MotE (MotC chaperone)
LDPFTSSQRASREKKRRNEADEHAGPGLRACGGTLWQRTNYPRRMRAWFMAMLLLASCGKGEVEQQKKDELKKLDDQKKAIEERNERERKRLEEERERTRRLLGDAALPDAK